MAQYPSVGVLAGKAAAPSLYCYTDSDTGIFFESGEVCFAVNGAKVGSFDSEGINFQGSGAFVGVNFSVDVADFIVLASDDVLLTCESMVVTATGDVTLTITDDFIVSGDDVTFTVDDMLFTCDQYVIASDDANALTVGPNGTTTPILKVDASTASAAAGLSITGAASGSGVALASIGGTNELLSITAKGSSNLVLAGGATGLVAVNDTLVITETGASVFAAGRLGSTTPALAVVGNVSNSVTGISITPAATGTAVTVAATGSATDEKLLIEAKAAGTIGISTVSTGLVSIASAASHAGVKIGPGTEQSAIKGIYSSGSTAVTVPAIANDAAENVDSVAVSLAGLTFACAVGDQVLAAPLNGLPTDCLMLGAYVSATDEVTVVFGSKEGGGGVTSAAHNFNFMIFDLT